MGAHLLREGCARPEPAPLLMLVFFPGDVGLEGGEGGDLFRFDLHGALKTCVEEMLLD